MDENEYHEPEFLFGLTYQASTAIRFLGELRKQDQISKIAVASEYSHDDVFLIRLGVIPKDLLWTAGLGFKIKKTLSMNLAYQLQEKLGGTYSLSVEYSL